MSWSAEVLSAELSDSGVVAFRVRYSDGRKTILETLNLGYPDGFLSNTQARLDQLEKASTFLETFTPGPVEKLIEIAKDPDREAFLESLAKLQACRRAVELGIVEPDSKEVVDIQAAAQQAFKAEFLSQV